MKIALVLPRNMHFGPQNASSIDLCAYDYIKHSRYGESICAFHRPVTPSYEDVLSQPCPKPTKWVDQLCFKTGFEEAIGRYKPDLILCEQHLPTAYRLARYFSDIPVVVRRHNFMHKKANPFMAGVQRARLNRLAGVISVSQMVQDVFHATVGKISPPLHVVHNGIDVQEWKPADKKEKLIVFAGRLLPEKGVREAAEGVNLFLKENKDWKACFLCVPSLEKSAYDQQVKHAAQLYPDRFQLLFDQPITKVQEMFGKAMIALVPSVFEEPFGRTAIEAMASQAALICSATGGMAEIATSTTARTLEKVSAACIVKELNFLAENEIERLSLAHKGRERVEEHFEIGQVSRHFDDVLRRLV